MVGWNNSNLDPAIVAVAELPAIEIDTLSGQVFTWTATQDAEISFINDGQNVTLVVTCGAIAKVLDWAGGGIHADAADYTLTANKKHTFDFVYDGTEHVLKSITVLS